MARRRFSDIRPFFDKDQWSELGDYEKNSYQNSKENYEAMIKAALLNNWMALVRDAAEARDLKRHVNLGPMEYGGRLYFVTLCDIPAGQELVIRFPPAFKVDTVCGREFGSAVTLSQHQRANASCAAELRRRRRALAELQRAKTSKPAAASTPPSSPGPRGRRRRREGDEDYSPRDHKPLLTRGQKRELRRELQELTMNQFLDVEKRIGQGEHDCPQCGLHFGRACRLRAHVQEHHLAADRSMRDRFSTIPFTCSACPANFSSPKDLRSHVKMTHFGLHKHDGGGLSEASTATTASGAASPRASPRASPAPSPAPSSAPSPAPSSAPSSAPTLAASDTASEVPSDAESESDSEISDKPVAADSSLSSTTIETSMELDNSQDTSTESNP
ncbi:hypothetical protein FOCC_FOCC003741 [Frankliniella occidentalis]|nr:hypothetical protein FOCC_FOCC003741 [Frankliniella occidentalis]